MIEGLHSLILMATVLLLIAVILYGVWLLMTFDDDNLPPP